ncbi:MAG: ABC transporter permease, partial [bacterium]
MLILICFVIIIAVVVAAALGDLIAPRDPNAQDISAALAKPSAEHLLGTDQLGRDIFSRIIVGARSAFLGPLVIAASAAFLGSILGLLSGYYG